ncbi:MAG: aromatic ring-hydroxylating dioxygenase subunit alpha [Pseudomonadota bacterium]
MSAADDRQELRAKLSAEQGKAGRFGLDPYFYRSEFVYARELRNLVFRSWIYAGHISEVCKAGDFLTVEVDQDSIIVTHGKDGVIRAFANTCRHRGARVCAERSGNTKRFVCPYHAWTYDLDGALHSARHMDARDDFDRSEYALKSLRVCIYMGLIFINGDPDASDFESPLSAIEKPLGAYQLEQAKIAHRQTYRITANWKFCLENYLECYHCGPAHKAYARMHTLQDTYERVETQVTAMRERAEQVTGVVGIAEEVRTIYGESRGFGACVSHSRYGLYDGYQTGSQDGYPVAPLMGKMRGYDGGAGDFQMGPLSFMLNYPDHCVLYRFLPRGIDATDVEIVWFVNGDAEEGRDYNTERLSWLWHSTTLEDKFIITQNRNGVLSHFFEPGPLQPEFEDILREFLEWYVAYLDADA